MTLETRMVPSSALAWQEVTTVELTPHTVDDTDFAPIYWDGGLTLSSSVFNRLVVRGTSSSTWRVE